MVRRSRAALAEAPLRLAEAPRPLSGPFLARLVGVDDTRRPLITWREHEAPRAARLGCALSVERAELAIAEGTPVLCLLDEDSEPIVMGLLETQCSETSPTTVASVDSHALPAAEQPASDTGWGLEAEVDGKRVRISAKDEIVLRCGEASITLRRNGKVVVRGTHVETYSSGTNRIKGGQVKIN